MFGLTIISKREYQRLLMWAERLAEKNATIDLLSEEVAVQRDRIAKMTRRRDNNGRFMKL